MEEIYQAVMEGDVGAAGVEQIEALGCRHARLDILQNGLIAAMDEVGRLFEQGDYYVPEMLIAAMAMKAGVQHLRPILVASGVEPIGKVVVGTVKGICMILEKTW